MVFIHIFRKSWRFLCRRRSEFRSLASGMHTHPFTLACHVDCDGGGPYYYICMPSQQTFIRAGRKKKGTHCRTRCCYCRRVTTLEEGKTEKGALNGTFRSLLFSFSFFPILSFGKWGSAGENKRMLRESNFGNNNINALRQQAGCQVLAHKRMAM